MADCGPSSVRNPPGLAAHISISGEKGSHGDTLSIEASRHDQVSGCHSAASTTSYDPPDCQEAFLVNEKCLDKLLECFVCIWCLRPSQDISKSLDDGGALSVTVLCNSGHQILQWSSHDLRLMKTQREIYQDNPCYHLDEQIWESVWKSAAAKTVTGMNQALLQGKQHKSRLAVGKDLQAPEPQKQQIDAEKTHGVLSQLHPSSTTITNCAPKEPTSRPQPSDAVKHPCQQCSKQFSLKCHLKLHERMHAGTKGQMSSSDSFPRDPVGAARGLRLRPREDSYACHSCHKRFPKARWLQAHQRYCKHAERGSVPSSLSAAAPGTKVKGKFEESGKRVKSKRRASSVSQRAPFTCQECGKILNSSVSFRLHELSHRAMNYPCSFCPRAFSDDTLLRHHLSIHSQRRPYSCKYCDKVFVCASNCRQHEMVHASDCPFKCHLCESHFPAENLRLDHERQSHPGKEVFRCEHCSRAFSHSRSHRLHVRKHLPSVASVTTCSLPDDKEEGEPGNSILDQLSNSGNSRAAATSSRAALETDQEKDRPESGISDKSISTESSVAINASFETGQEENMPEDSNSDNPSHPIDVAGDEEAGKSGVGGGGTEPGPSSILGKATSEPDAVDLLCCKFCGKALSTSDKLVTHERLHSGMMPYQCGHCPKMFVHREVLRWHEKHHSFSCTICREEFQTEGSLRDHRQQHEGASQPDIGDSATWSLAVLSQHDRDGLIRGQGEGANPGDEDTAAQRRGDEPAMGFRCEFCRMPFPTYASKRKHEATHTEYNPHKCSHCPKSFTRRNNLRRHEKTHSVEKLFTCSICGKGYNDKSYMSIHMRVHAGAKLYPCAICGEEFMWRKTRDKHHFNHSITADQQSSIDHTTVGDHHRGTPGKRPSAEGGTSSKRPTGAEERTPGKRPSSAEGGTPGKRPSAEGGTPGKRPSAEDGTSTGMRPTSAGGGTPGKRPSADEDGTSSGEESGSGGTDSQRHSQERANDINLSSPGKDEQRAALQDVGAPKPMAKSPGEAMDFYCEYCRTPFPTYASKRKHEATHTEPNPYKCSQCPKAYTQRNSLVRHEKTHSVDKHFTCSICGKGFNDRSYMSVHMRVHTGAKRYPCKVCGEEFMWRKTRDKHQTKHKDTVDQHLSNEYTTGADHNIDTPSGRPSAKEVTSNSGDTSGQSGTDSQRHSHERADDVTAYRPGKDERRAASQDMDFHCKYCQKEFATFGLKQKHEATHTEYKPYKCSLCSKSYTQRNNLRRHEKTHSVEKRFTCSICGEEFNDKSSMTVHMCVHSGAKSYPCMVCGEEFAWKKTRDEHQADHGITDEHQSQEPENAAAEVGQVTDDVDMDDEDYENVSIQPPSEDSTLAMYCADVDQEDTGIVGGHSGIVASRLRERKHPVSYQGQDDSIEETSSSIDGEEEVVGSDSGSVVSCLRERKDPVSYQDEDHSVEETSTSIDTEEEGGIPRCQYCNKRFTTKAAKTEHEAKHRKDKPFHCSQCKKIFARKNSLVRHQKLHTGNKPFACTVCNKRFIHNCTMLAHMRVRHSDQKQFSCRACQEMFKWESTRNRHERNHHPEFHITRTEAITMQTRTDDLQHADGDLRCRYCPERFPSEAARADHETVHIKDRPFQCSHCQKFFALKGSLRKHKKSHTSDMPLSCNICGKGFLNNSALLMHAPTHTNETVFNCRVCGDKFRSRRARKIHEQKNHPEFDPGEKEDEELEKEEEEKRRDNRRCSRCGQIFDNMYEVTVHEQMHTSKQMFNCPRCEMNFPIRTQCLTHLLRVHLGECPYKCRYCEDSFPNAEGRDTHHVIHTQHLGHSCTLCKMMFSSHHESHAHKQLHSDTPYRCNNCDRAFSFEADRDEHNMTCISTNPRDCRYCGQRFATWKLCRDHMRVHPAERPWMCSTCGKTYRLRSDLRHHEENHEDGKAHPCEVCGKNFPTDKSMKKHLNRHNLPLSHKCSYCEKSFKAKGERAAHERVHRGEKIFKCSYCDLYLSDRTAKKQHELIHTGEEEEEVLEKGEKRRDNRKCSRCGHIFDNVYEATVHEQMHTSKQMFNCPRCEMNFPIRAECLTHLLRVHLGECPFKCRYCEDSFPDAEGRDTHHVIHTQHLGHSCSLCKMKFSSHHESHAHEQLHSDAPYRCNNCDEAFSFEANRDEHNMTCISTNARDCRYCGQGFATWKLCRDHMEVHPAERPWMCSTCGKTFRLRSVLRHHEENHEDGKDHPCEVCGKNFPTDKSMKKHLKQHNLPLSHNCSYCEKSFKRKDAKAAHERTHRGDKIFKCSYCDLHLGGRTARKHHEMIHIGAMPFKCDICERPFRHNSAMKRHRRLHTGEKPYPCQYCGQRYKDIRSRKVHELSHTGEHPHVCMFCGKAFRDPNKLRRHEKIHRGVKDLKCLYCDESFAYSTSRKNHTMRVHPVEFKAAQGKAHGAPVQVGPVEEGPEQDAPVKGGPVLGSLEKEAPVLKDPKHVYYSVQEGGGVQKGSVQGGLDQREGPVQVGRIKWRSILGSPIQGPDQGGSVQEGPVQMSTVREGLSHGHSVQGGFVQPGESHRNIRGGPIQANAVQMSLEQRSYIQQGHVQDAPVYRTVQRGLVPRAPVRGDHVRGALTQVGPVTGPDFAMALKWPEGLLTSSALLGDGQVFSGRSYSSAP